MGRFRRGAGDWNAEGFELLDEEYEAVASLPRYDESNYLQFAAAANGGGFATDALLGIGNTWGYVVKLARRTRTGIGGYLFGVLQAPGFQGLRCEVTGADGPGEYAVIAYDGAPAILTNQRVADLGWGPTVISFASSDAAGGDFTFQDSACHVGGVDTDLTLGGSISPDSRSLSLACLNPGAGFADLSFVSITALTVKPTAAELNAFSLKGVMAWDVWPTADIFQHYHTGSLYDDGGTWKLAQWPGSAGPAVEMVLGSAVSDANLTPWTTPAIPWPTQPHAMMTGDTDNGEGDRYLDSQAGRVMTTGTGRACLVKATRDADAAVFHYYMAVNRDSGSVADGDMVLRNQAGGVYPAATSLSLNQEGTSWNVPVAGDHTKEVVSALGVGFDGATGDWEAMNTGVRATGTVAASALATLTRVTLSARKDNAASEASLIANHMVQEALTLLRKTVGDEWLTYSLNRNVDPRLIWGPDLQHVWSLAYIDIDTQSVPDIADGADALDSLDVQGRAVQAGQIIPINVDGTPAFNSFSTEYDASFGD